jgi:hypothetical protein
MTARFGISGCRALRRPTYMKRLECAPAANRPMSELTGNALAQTTAVIACPCQTSAHQRASGAPL